MTKIVSNPGGFRGETLHGSWSVDISICQYCSEYSLWEKGVLLYPFQTELPGAHPDMPNEVKGIYEEATKVFQHSPRAAAALLRLAIETMIPLIEEYEIKKAKLNTMIGILVQKGIPDHIQQGLDTIRIYGNEGIHPGEIVLNDDEEIVFYMFELINDMIEELISRKTKIRQAYAKIPADKIKGILNRDRNSKPKDESTN
ncbi:hypothetical protein ASG99_26495 [Bacillus sp. Soil768D1]|nr:hypothetical protein ASG99_26495 [Bacillus sp. Soil768D1]